MAEGNAFSPLPGRRRRVSAERGLKVHHHQADSENENRDWHGEQEQ